ncbi:MAG: TolC family protein [Deltaproteobacteria bacterium]|nr:TolC family protein [Deltaproteobacteria bacterium]
MIVSALATSRLEAAPIPFPEAVSLALEAGPSLALARARLAQTEARRGIASSELYPTVGLSFSGRWDGSTASPVRDSSGVTHPFQNAVSYQLSGSASERIFDFGRRAGRIQAAAHDVESAKLDRQTAALEIEAAVFAAYTELLASEAASKVAGRVLAEIEAQLRHARALRALDLRSEIDVLSAEARLKLAELRRTESESARAQSTLQLAIAMGGKGPDAIEAEDWLLDPLELEDQAPLSLVAEAFTSRAELARAEAQLAARRAILESIRAESFPTVDVGLGTSLLGNDAAVGPYFALFGALSVSHNLFAGFSTTYGVANAEADVAASLEEVAQTRLAIRAEVEGAKLDVEELAAKLALATSAKTSAEQLARLARIRYETRLGSYIEVGNAIDALEGALARELDVRYGLSKARGRLLRAMGRRIVGRAGRPTPANPAESP